jgi:signal transduction histidine kinase
MEARLIGDPRIPVPGEISEELYAIALEALNNILKHAETDAVTVSIHFDGQLLTMEVVDNGRGFDLDNALDSGGMGLGSMKQRAARLGGELTIESALDQGTRVKVTVPLTPDIITPPDHTEISE